MMLLHIAVMDWLTTEYQKAQKWSEFHTAAVEILDSAIKAVRAVNGNGQLFNPKNRALQIIAHRGFDHEFCNSLKTYTQMNLLHVAGLSKIAVEL